MTKQEALRYFRENIQPYVGSDPTSIRTAWNDWTDSLQKDGQITQRQYETWLGPRTRKTSDTYVLQGNYGHGWEDLTAENTLAEIRQRRKEYRENEGGEYRITKRRLHLFGRDPQQPKAKRGSIQRARIDRKGTAKPRSRIVGRFPKDQCIGPFSTPPGGYEYRESKPRRKTRRDPQPNTPASRGPRNSGPVAPQARCPVGTQVQSVILSKNFFNQREAKSWISRNDFRISKVDETVNSWRFRQQPPDWFEKRTFRTIRLRPGVTAVIGCPIFGGN